MSKGSLKQERVVTKTVATRMPRAEYCTFVMEHTLHGTLSCSSIGLGKKLNWTALHKELDRFS